MISLILVYKSDRSSSEFDLEDDFSLLERLYKNQPKNVVFFEQSFDCMVNIQNKARRSNSLILNPIDIFFNSYLSKDYHEHEKSCRISTNYRSQYFQRGIDRSRVA